MDIAPIVGRTGDLSRLRPVSFHLKNDPQGAVQYGLIAEDVDKVFPELVIRDDRGEIQGVRYDELAPMLLGVVQQQQAKIAADELKIQTEAEHAAAQDETIQAQARTIADVKTQATEAKAELKMVATQVQAALAQLQAHDARMAIR